MYRKILVAFDGSPSGRNALKGAIRMARADGSWIKALAVVPPYDGDLDLIGVPNIKDAIEGPGRKLVGEAKAIAEGEAAPIIADMEQGEPYDRIVHVAEDEHCDLIVMGRRGETRIERDLMGSVTARVIGHTTKDVLVVPDDADIAWGNILLATDGSPYSAAATERAIELAKANSSRLTAISVVNVPDEFYAEAPKAINDMIAKARETLETVKAKASDAGIAAETMVREGEPHQAINFLAAEIHADLIIMGSHGRKGLTRLLMGSVTEKVIGFSPIPVLISHLAP